MDYIHIIGKRIKMKHMNDLIKKYLNKKLEEVKKSKNIPKTEAYLDVLEYIKRLETIEQQAHKKIISKMSETIL